MKSFWHLRFLLVDFFKGTICYCSIWQFWWNYYIYGASSHRNQWTDKTPSFKMGVWKILCCEFWDNNSSITHSSLMHNDLNQFLYAYPIIIWSSHEIHKTIFFKSHLITKRLVSTLNIMTRCTMNIIILAKLPKN